MSFSFGAGVRDGLSNLAASLGTGRDKAAHDAFVVFELGRAQIEAMYRGDWLARKVVDIVPYDSVRAWRSWSEHRAEVARPLGPRLPRGGLAYLHAVSRWQLGAVETELNPLSP